MNEEEPREYTVDEVRDMIINKVWNLIDYWSTNPMEYTKRQALEGLAHSLLTMLDGGNVDLPAFLVTPLPSGEDKEYFISQGENWFPQNMPDLGMLHEYLYKGKGE